MTKSDVIAQIEKSAADLPVDEVPALLGRVSGLEAKSNSTPRVQRSLPESVREELTTLLAEILVLDFQTHPTITDKSSRGIARTRPSHRTAQAKLRSLP